MNKYSRMFCWSVLTVIVVVPMLMSARADSEKIGVYETVYRSTVSYTETAKQVEAALIKSDLVLHAWHDVRVPGNLHQARIFIVTSPEYMAVAKDESPRTVSAQVMRLSVYTTGEAQQAFINMSNPRAHAMVYYTGSDNYAELLSAAGRVGQRIREIVSQVPGESLSIQQEPSRSEKHYRNYNGDGPAKMMARFRNFEKSQLEVVKGAASAFDDLLTQTGNNLNAGEVGDESDREHWEVIAKIAIGDDAVYFGLSNPYLEDRMIRINSSFRNDQKSEASPFPGVDHLVALPTDVLVIREEGKTRVLQYGQMWRMQLYFWDSGYRAFTANAAMPGKIAKSIRNAVRGD